MGYQIRGYDQVQGVNPGEFVQLSAGGYICHIVHAEIAQSKAGRDMLVLYIDIAEGEFANYFKNQTDREKQFDSNKKWTNAGIYRQMIYNNDGSCSKFLKGFLNTMERSNAGLKINGGDFEPSDLHWKLCGFVFGQEEYEKQNGDIGTRTVICFPRTVDTIREGKFKVPELKKLNKPAAESAANQDALTFEGKPVEEIDTPF